MKTSRHFPIHRFVLMVAFGLSIVAGRTASAEWVGKFNRTMARVTGDLKYCADTLEIKMTIWDGHLNINFSGPKGFDDSFSISDREELKVRWTKRDDWDVGFVRKGRVVTDRTAFDVETRAVLGFGFIPALIRVGVIANLSQDGRHLTIRHYKTSTGFGTRSRCDYERVR